jgi:hypothetical protein
VSSLSLACFFPLFFFGLFLAFFADLGTGGGLAGCPSSLISKTDAMQFSISVTRGYKKNGLFFPTKLVTLTLRSALPALVLAHSARICLNVEYISAS